MSLVSNLKSPFTKTTPVVTIVLLAVLFAVFRLSGGSVRVERKPARTPERRIEVNRPSASLPRSSDSNKQNQIIKHSENAGTISLSDSESEDFMRKVLENRRAKDAANQKEGGSNSATGTTRRSGLDDIEKDLGLR